MDRLAIEGIAFEDLLDSRITGIVGEQARHWHRIDPGLCDGAGALAD